MPCPMRLIVCCSFALAATIAARAQIQPELEPNDSKATATVVPFPIVPGAGVTGTSTSATTTGLDYFLLHTQPMPLAVYRWRMVINSATVGHTGTIRGLTQTAGVVNPGTDAAIQTSSTTTSPPRFNQWYGFGRGEQIYYRVTGSATTTAPYTCIAEMQPVPIMPIGVFSPGNIEITTVGQGHTTDTDLWVYDGALNPIPTYGNDDEFGTTVTQSRLTRNYGPGTYVIALSSFNLANDQPSPPDDDFRTGGVMDFRESVADSSTTTNQNMMFRVTDSAGLSVSVPATKAEPYQVLWFSFDVGAPCQPTCDLDHDGDADIADVNIFLNCIATGCGNCEADFNGDGLVDFGDINAACAMCGGPYCGGGGSGACCIQGATCAVMPESQCRQQGGIYQGDGTLCNATRCEPCADCGPGPHWMHSPPCPAGTDGMPSGALVGIDTNLDCVRDQNLVLFGPAYVRRSGVMDDSTQYPGTRPVDGHLDVIDTEMTELTLTGGGATLIAGAGRGAIPLSATRGAVAEQPADPSQADSFFDVFFEITVGAQRLYNQTPLRASSIITCFPPNDNYFHPTGICIPLYTSPVPGQGVHVANLVSANHDTFPRPGACCINQDCTQLTSVECQAAGGTFFGEGSTCTPGLCIRRGACCINGGCTVMDETACRGSGGLYQGDGTVCTTDRCEPCAECGPGPHWLHNPPCPPGTDAMPSGALIGIDTNLDCVRDQNLVMFGPSYVQRNGATDDSLRFPGIRPVDGHTDVVDTEMRELTLTGGGATLIAGFGRGAISLAATYGAVAEQPGDPSLADSFFDVFFELTLSGGQRLYNQTPLRANSTITCFPPNDNYFHPTGICIPLYTSPVAGQGVHVANLVSANHDTFPRPGACCINGNCTQLTSVECGAAGGVFHGEGVPCSPTICAPVGGACCIQGAVCQIMSETQCRAQGGIYQGDGTLCTATRCEPCADCGPGPHWLHNPPCPAGTDGMPSGALVGIDTNLDCVRDQNLVLFGPAYVRRTAAMDDSAQYPGTRPIDGHTDVVDTEMTELTLSGGGAALIAGAGRGAIPLSATRGAVAEQPGNPSLADSFFDVFFELTIGTQRLYNQTPLRASSVITCFPPNDNYFHPTGICIPLYTSPIPGQGVHVANLVSANHDTFPRPGACCINGNCSQLTSVDCGAAGGTFFGEGVPCSPTICPQVRGACCIQGSCTILDEATCRGQGGLYQGDGVPCSPNPCVPCGLCGPGPHFIDVPPCPAGTETIPSGALVGIDTNLDCVRDQNLVLFGPVTIRRNNPSDDSSNYPGTRPIDNHLDVIDTEILAMSLTGGGATLVAGAGQGQGGVLGATRGNIAEQPGNPSLADSFFDVFFEVSIGAQRLYNQTPLRAAEVITCIPPNGQYIHPVGICIPLFTSPVPGQGVHMANLVSAYHDTFPIPGACCLPGQTNCTLLTRVECDAAGGVFHGEGVPCSPNPCIQLTGACCINGNCQVLSRARCADAGGLYQGDGTTCTPGRCGPCAACGPGPHWIHNPPCPAGEDAMPSGAVVGIDTNLDCVRDVNLVMFGPAQVRRTGPLDDSGNFPGTRPVDGHLDVIDTEMVSLTLTGSGATLIAGAGRGAIPLTASLGNVAETPSNPLVADSFFDVFFEITTPSGAHLYNQVPLRPTARITCLPPDANYQHPTGICIPLYTSPVPGQGVHVANLVSANHQTYPGPCFGHLRGDSNCDGVVDNGDIDCFVRALLDPGSWNVGCNPNGACDYVCANDTNQDGIVDNGDIDSFVQLLLGNP